MRFQEILARLTGLSSPVFGVSWNPKEPEIAVAKRVIVFLEDRRVLYVPSEMESPSHCVKSILEIRRYLTQELQTLGEGSELAASLRAMRAACRKFLTAMHSRQDLVLYGAHHGHWASWEFNGGLGELRGVFGVHIARLAAAHGLGVEGDLASILPSPIDDRSGVEDLEG